MESKIANAGDIASQGYIGQSLATVEGIFTNAGNTVGDHNAGQAGTPVECVAADAGNAFGDCHIRKFFATFKRIITDGCDAAGNY
jgi:hypothetical protein